MNKLIRILVLLSVLLIIFPISLSIFIMLKERIDFNSTIWKLMPNNSGYFAENINLRILMKDDLRNNFLSKGKSEKEVLDILGTPYLRTNNHFRYSGSVSERLESDLKNIEYILVYPLGIAFVNEFYLVIAFNKNNILIDSWIAK